MSVRGKIHAYMHAYVHTCIHTCISNVLKHLYTCVQKILQAGEAEYCIYLKTPRNIEFFAHTNFVSALIAIVVAGLK